MSSNPGTLTQKHEHINRAWASVEDEAQQYGINFAENFKIEIQEVLPLGRLRGSSYRDIRVEYIDEYSDVLSGNIGGETDFVTDKILAPAYTEGFLGHRQLSIEQDELDRVENDLLTEASYNEYGAAPKPSKKIEGQNYFIHIFTRQELARYATYWYLMGAENRLSECANQRRILEQQEEFYE